ncbi:histamine N-methyltransferase A-like [Mantella aurantiaca]
MQPTMKTLISDNSRYVESFRLFLQNSTEHQCMQHFIDTKLAPIMYSIGDGKSVINVLGVGSGKGEIDLQMLSKIQDKYPGISINNNIVEPNTEHIMSYKERVAKTPGLEHITFRWNTMTSTEFEVQVKKEKQDTKYDFIHMIQMLYYVKDVPATLSFFTSLLSTEGKLLIILISGNSVWPTLWKKYESHLLQNDMSMFITAGEVADMLSSMGAKYQSFDLQSELDISECFVEGDRNGELLLDFVTQTCEFKRNAPAKLREEMMETLKSPGCSFLRDGKIFYKNHVCVIVVENK